jgi:hypothetical protein
MCVQRYEEKLDCHPAQVEQHKIFTARCWRKNELVPNRFLYAYNTQIHNCTEIESMIIWMNENMDGYTEKKSY